MEIGVDGSQFPGFNNTQEKRLLIERHKLDRLCVLENQNTFYIELIN